MSVENGDVFISKARGCLKVFKALKNFGCISSVRLLEDSGRQLDEVWFFGSNHMPATVQPGIHLEFEVWENSEGKPLAYAVRVDEEGNASERAKEQQRMQEAYAPHPNEPRTIYPSVYVSDIPVEYSEETVRELHKALGLNPDMIVGMKFLPSKLGNRGDGTGSVIIRYGNDEVANSAVEKLRGHPIRLSDGHVKYVGARHAAPATWMDQRRSFESNGSSHGQPKLDSYSFKPASAQTKVASDPVLTPKPTRALEPLLPSASDPSGKSHVPAVSSSLAVDYDIGNNSWTSSSFEQAQSTTPIASWGGDPYFKTQPCPYHLQGMCPNGAGCFYAHSPEELRPAPSQPMMMGQMFAEKKRKEKKLRKEKKDKRNALRAWSDSGDDSDEDRSQRKRTRQVFDDNDL